MVTKVTPGLGPTLGGTLVTVKGNHLRTAGKVLFGSTPGTQLHVVSDRKLTVVSPAHAEGVVDLKVQTRGGKSARGGGARFNFFAERPQVIAIAPGSRPAAGGTVVTVTGTGFLGVSAVRFDGIPGTAVTVASSTRLMVTSPAHGAYVAHINVTTPTGTSPSKTADRYDYVP